MNNSQDKKDEANKPTESSFKVTNNRLTTENSLFKYPFSLMFWLLATSLGVSISSYYSITYVGDMPKTEIISLVVIDQPTTTLTNYNNPTPLWLLIAIAASCGSGCLVILVILTRSNHRQKFSQNSRYYHKSDFQSLTKH